MTPSAEEQILDLIYGAAVQPSLWVDVVERLISITDGEAGALTRLDIEDGTGSVIVSNSDASVLDSFFSHYHRINPLQLVDDPAAYVTGWRPKVLVDEDWMPRDAFERSEYYNDFLRPLSAEWNLMVRLGLSGTEVAAISVARPYGRGRFESSQIASAARLQQHLVRAYALSESFVALDALNADLTQALDQSSSATLLVDGAARILHANSQAERLLKQGDVLCARDGRLGAGAPQSAQTLATVIAQAATDDWERRSAGSVPLNAPGRHGPLTVTASPLRLEPVAGFARGPAVLVTVTEQGAAISSREAGLVQRFGLTAAEARLGVALLDELSLRQASDLHKVSINTVRVQLASIFAKTGTHRQIDLVRLMMTAAETRVGEFSS